MTKQLNKEQFLEKYEKQFSNFTEYKRQTYVDVAYHIYSKKSINIHDLYNWIWKNIFTYKIQTVKIQLLYPLYCMKVIDLTCLEDKFDFITDDFSVVWRKENEPS